MLYESAKFSLYAQIITGAIDSWGLTLKVPIEKELLKTLLKIELAVQIVELSFYIWLVKNIKTNSNVTRYRYFDWMITTPLMLLTLMALLASDSYNYNSLQEFIDLNKTLIKEVFVLNFLMLYFGYLGETGVIPIKKSVILGFIPFLLYYKKIYDSLIKNKNVKPFTKKIFFYFFLIWSIYGVAALFPYKTKNIFYNILDLFSKNLFGLFLVYNIYTNRID